MFTAALQYDDSLTVLAESLRVVSSAVLFGAGVLYLSFARRVDNQPSTLPGVALIVFGALSMPLKNLTGLAYPSSLAPVPGTLTRLLVTIVTLGLILAALRTSTRAPARTAVTVTVALALTGCGCVLITTAHETFGPDPTGLATLRAGLELTAAVGWFGTAITAAVSAGRMGATWVRPTAAALALMGAVSVLRAAAVYSVAWALAAAVLSTVTSGVVLAGVWARSEEASSRHQRRREEIVHDARNAVAALRAASTTLSRHGDALDALTRQHLRSAVLGEIDQLEYLVDRADGTAVVAFDLASVIDPIAQAQRARGLEVTVRLGESRVLGRPGDVAAVVQNLLVNARRHANGSAVAVRAHGWGSGVRIWIEDAGPGIPADRRETVFDRGVAGGDTAGSGLGLHIARTLMRAQGGEIEVCDGPAGGTSFVLTLPHPGAVGGPTLRHHPVAGRLLTRSRRRTRSAARSVAA